MNKLTTKKAKEIRSFIGANRDLLDMDAAAMGLKLTDGQKEFIVRKLRPLVRRGTEIEKVKSNLKKRTRELITDVSKWKQKY
jgi:hypothetical protein